MVISERPPETTRAQRDAWLLEEYLPKRLPGSVAALCLSLDPLALPEASPVYVPPDPAADRRSLELFFFDAIDGPAGQTADPGWTQLVAPFGEAQASAGMGEVGFAAAFVVKFEQGT